MCAAKRSASLDHQTKGAFHVDHLLREVSAHRAAHRRRNMRSNRPFDGADIVAGLTAVPAPLLLYAGLSLFPVAIFIGLVGTRETLAPPAVWVVIVGNALWVAGSLLLLFGGMIAPNAWGFVFIGAQAAAVAVLAELEYFGLRQTLAVAH